MKANYDTPYTPELVEAVFKLWPQFESGRLSGSLSIKESSSPQSFENKVSSETLRYMIPKALRVSNTYNCSDNACVIICDVETAMLRVCTPLQIARLRRLHYRQYTLEEIAKTDGVAFQSVDESIKACYGKIAAELERPKIAKKEAAYVYEEPTHKRTYWHGHDVPRVR